MCSQLDHPPYDVPTCDCGAPLAPDHEHVDVATLVAAAPMPLGYSLSVRPQRKYAHRSLWNVRVLRDGERVYGRAYYNVAAGIVAAQKWAWDTAWVRV